MKMRAVQLREDFVGGAAAAAVVAAVEVVPVRVTVTAVAVLMSVAVGRTDVLRSEDNIERERREKV